MKLEPYSTKRGARAGDERQRLKNVKLVQSLVVGGN